MCVRFLFYLRHTFSSLPPPSSSSSSSRPRRRAFFRRRRRAAHSRHDSACWPPRRTPGGSFSLNPTARHPPRLLPPGTRAREPLLCRTVRSSYRRLARPSSPPLSAGCSSGPLRRAPSAVPGESTRQRLLRRPSACRFWARASPPPRCAVRTRFESTTAGSTPSSPPICWSADKAASPSRAARVLLSHAAVLQR